MGKHKLWVSENLAKRFAALKKELQFESDDEMFDVVLAVLENFKACSTQGKDAKTRGSLLWLSQKQVERLDFFAKANNTGTHAEMIDKLVEAFQFMIDEQAKEGVVFGAMERKGFDS